MIHVQGAVVTTQYARRRRKVFKSSYSSVSVSSTFEETIMVASPIRQQESPTRRATIDALNNQIKVNTERDENTRSISMTNVVTSPLIVAAKRRKISITDEFELDNKHIGVGPIVAAGNKNVNLAKELSVNVPSVAPLVRKECKPAVPSSTKPKSGGTSHRDIDYNVCDSDQADLFAFGGEVNGTFDITVLRKSEGQSGIIMIQQWEPTAPTGM